MAGGRQLLANALQNFVFSLSQGMAASAQAPGARGTRMGMAAALGAPMQLQEIMRQREAQDQERQMKIQEFQNQLRQGKINEALAMLKVQQGRPAPQTLVSFEAQGQTPVGALPGQTQAAIPSMNASIRGQLPAIPSPMGPLQPQSAEELADVQAMDPEFKIRQQNQQLAQQREDRLRQQAQEALNTALTKAGYKAVRDAEGNLTGTQRMDPSELSEIEQRKLKDAENLSAYRETLKELAVARTELAKLQADPSSPQYQLLRQRVQALQDNVTLRAKALALGEERLGISQGNLDVREKQFELGAVGQYAKVRPILDSVYELSKKINTQQGVIAKISGEVEKAKAQVNLNDDVAEYQALVQSFTPLWARALGHTGVLTQQDVDSAREALPKPGDSDTLAQRKMARIEKVLAGTEKATRDIIGPKKTPATKAPTGGGWTVKVKP